MNKTLKHGLILLLISILIACVVFYLNLKNEGDKLSGHLVFAQTAEQGLKLNKIRLLNTTEETTLFLQDNYWKIAEGDNYYANLSLTNALFNAMNNSRFLSSHPADEKTLSEYKLKDPRVSSETDTGTLIQTYVDDTLIDEIILGKKTDNNLYIFAKKPGLDEIWLVSNFFTLPRQRLSWYQQPLLNYAPDTISSFQLTSEDGRQQLFYRPERGRDFVTDNNKPAHLSLLSEYFTYLIFEDVKSEQNFVLSDFPQHKTIQIKLFSGLYTDLDIYTDNQSYWVKLKIYSNPLTTLQIKDYIKNNSFLYQGWYFKLASDTGRFLFNSLKIDNNEAANN